MNKPKILDCITFFDNNYIFDIRYNILKNFVDYFVICESLYDHKGNKKEKNFKWKKNYNKKKIIYRCIKKPFPKKNSPWENQAIQREILLSYTDFANGDDYIFFSDPDEIPNPKLLKNFSLKKNYGIFLQKCFNYKFNLFNKFESPWEGTRVAKKKNLKSIDFMRQSVKSKNLKYNFFRIDKERSIEIYENGGWHFNNIMQPKDISLKLKTFAHQEFSGKNFSNIETIKKKIKNRFDLFNRGHKYKAIKLDSSFPIFITKNKKKFKNYIEKID